jgi:hypothetical protein
MSLETFDLGAMSCIDDERVRIAFEQALKRCVLDCEDRPRPEQGAEDQSHGEAHAHL